MDRLRSTNVTRVLLVVFAVALIALAGCTGGGNGNAPDTTTTDTPPMTETTTTSSTPTPTPTDGVNSSALVANHSAAIQSLDSFTGTQTIRFESTRNGSTSMIEADQRTHFDAQNGLGFSNFSQAIQTPQGTQSQIIQTYTSGNETFLRANSTTQTEPQFAYGQEPYNSSEPSPVSVESAGSVSTLSGVNGTFQSQGTTTYNGQTVTEYTASGEENLPGITATFGQSFTEIDSISATLYVNGDGVITYMDISISGSSNDATTSLEATFTVEDIDATTVTEPSWLDQVNATG